MTILKLQTGTDNPILRKKSDNIQKIDKKIKKLVENMAQTLQSEDGLGLAAPQVGINKRLILARFNHGTKEEMFIPMINPVITETSEEKVCAEEGCLSLPEKYDQVERFKRIRVKFQDVKGMELVFELEDLNARIVQHEIDHLDGVLFVDRVKTKKTEECSKDKSIL